MNQPRSQGFFLFSYREGGEEGLKARSPVNEVDYEYIKIFEKTTLPNF